MNVVRQIGLRAPMADGVELVADAWYPAEGGPWPVLLQRLPYGRSVASSPVLPHPSWFARHGYAVVVQDCRGRGESGGTFAPFVHEAADGAATIEWAARLPFADGRVATYGFSYQGLAQLYAAAERPPSLWAIAPMMCCPDPYEGWTYEGGALRWPFVCFWAAQLAGQDRRSGPLPFDTAAVPPAAALGPEPPEWFTEWLAHPRDDEYWQRRRPDLAAIDVPAFTVLGWFDDFSSGTARLIEALRAEAWCGPWAHMPWGTRHCGHDFGPDASPGGIGTALVRFFDRVFGRRAGPSPGVRWFVIGEGWRDSPTWPPATRPLTLYGASATGDALSRWGDGLLAPAQVSRSVPVVLVAEPQVAHPGDPVDFQDETAAQERRDVACFTTDRVGEPLVVAGSPRVRVTTRADVERHDLVAVLALVESDGTARAVTGYARRALDPAPPGTETAWEIFLRPIALAVAAGQRLRLALSAHRFPTYDRNPHTTEHDPATPVEAQRVATIEILEVTLDLPVVP